MVSNKAPRGHSSKVSSSSAPAATFSTQTAQKSSVLRSHFAPSEFQLSLFASVIHGFEGQHLRIHDTITGRLRCEHTIKSKATINCLEWGYYRENNGDRSHQESKKKRKRKESTNDSPPDPKDFVIAFGTSDSEIALLSPSESKIVGVLHGEHTQGIRDFKFVQCGYHGKGWSVGGDGKIVQWNLQTGKSIMSLRAPSPSVVTLLPVTETLLCASHTAYILDLETTKETHSFTASSNPIHTILSPSPANEPFSVFLTASEAERAINVFDVSERKLAGTLVPEAETIRLALSSAERRLKKHQSNGEISNGISHSTPSLATVNKEGAVELFPSPFDFAKVSKHADSASLKARRKRMTRKAAAVIKIVRPDKSAALVPVLDLSFEGNDIVVAWTEGGVNVLFDRIKWQEEDTGRVLLEGVHEIVKGKVGAGIGAVVMNGVKDMGKSYVDDSHTVVANGVDAQIGVDPSSAIDISSAEDESEYSDDDEQEDEPILPEPISHHGSQEDEHRQLGVVSEDVEMQDPGDQDASGGKVDDETEEGEGGEPSFGEMIRAKAQEAIDVQASFPPENPQLVALQGEKSLHLPSGMSLGTVLAQSLRTNDVSLLESCFHVRDLQTVRATIERVDSSLATVLLQRLAERLHSRPGRAGSLMVWIQWTLVAHGGYLASQPEVMRKLTSLHRVVAERANSLQSLLSLKGKLDMLEAQMNIRKSIHARSRAANALDDKEEEGIIYVEGQEESDSEKEASRAIQSPQKLGKVNQSILNTVGSGKLDNTENPDEEDEGDDHGDEMPPTTNGVIPDSEDEGSESEDEGPIDDEAVSTDNDSDNDISEDEADYDDVSSIDSEASSGLEDIPPAKRLAKTKVANRLD